MNELGDILVSRDETRLQSLLGNFTEEPLEWLCRQANAALLQRQRVMTAHLARGKRRTLVNIVGKQFGDLVIVEELPSVRRPGLPGQRRDLERKVKCRCAACGKEDIVQFLHNLTRPSAGGHHSHRGCRGRRMAQVQASSAKAALEVGESAPRKKRGRPKKLQA